MSEIGTVTEGHGSCSTPCLPSFITASSIANKLGWVPSLQRLFRQHVQSHPVQGWTMPTGDIYAAIVELLCLPGGLDSFENRVATFDPKGRGLLRAISDAAKRQLPPPINRPKTPVALMKALIDREEWDIAAWLAWSLFEVPSQNSQPNGFEEIYELVQSHEELTSRLGDYLQKEGWSRELNRESEAPMHSGTSEEGTERIALEERWSEEINALIQRLSK